VTEAEVELHRLLQERDETIAALLELLKELAAAIEELHKA